MCQLRLLRMIPIPVLSAVLAACAARPVATPVPAVNAGEIVKQGDAAFQESHLYSWRQAERFYKKAYDLEPSDVIKEKLLLARFLIVTRQADEDIADPGMDASFEAVCSGKVSAKQKFLCDLAKRYRAVSGTGSATQEEMPGRDLVDVEKSPLDAYIHTLYVQAHGIKETNETAGARAEKYRESPLFVYLYLGKKTAQRAEELAKTSPNFAELSDFMGGLQFQRMKYGAARDHFKRALELIPDYTRSRNGLGNICLFALEDYERAMEHYQLSIKYDPGNAAALYGTGLVFHHLGKYAESNSYLNRMLQGDLSRGGHNSEEAVRYYQGEANYYIAYNLHLLGEREKAREYVEVAKRYLPMSEHTNYLSGLLYYQAGNLREARHDFMRVLQGGATNCDAQYYLGRIYRETHEELDEQPPEQTAGVKAPAQLTEYLEGIPLQREPKDKRSANYFLASCSCMQTNIGNMEGQIKSVPAMDLDDAEKVLFQGRLKNKLADYRTSSSSLIEGMMRLTSTSEVEKKDDYLILMGEMRERILAAENPVALPSNSP